MAKRFALVISCLEDAPKNPQGGTNLVEETIGGGPQRRNLTATSRGCARGKAPLIICGDTNPTPCFQPAGGSFRVCWRVSKEHKPSRCVCCVRRFGVDHSIWIARHSAPRKVLCRAISDIFTCLIARTAVDSSSRISCSLTFASMSRTQVVSSGLSKIALRIWYIGVMPVPPHIMTRCGNKFALATQRDAARNSRNH